MLTSAVAVCAAALVQLYVKEAAIQRAKERVALIEDQELDSERRTFCT